MGKRVLRQYRGRLTPVQVAEGMNLALSNAKRLAEDAKALLDVGRHATAASLAILSLEEIGKTPILRRLLTAVSQTEVEICWKDYRSHTAKNYFALMPDYVRNGARSLDEFGDFFTNKTESERASFDAVKQIGFYTNCCGDAHWSTPAEIIDKDLASTLVGWALLLTHDKQEVTVQELELWISNIRAGLTKENLLNWYAAMVEAGLRSKEDLHGFRHFVLGKPTVGRPSLSDDAN
jgi:AbiV family abortive infection protein